MAPSRASPCQDLRVMIAEPSVQSLFLVAMCNGLELGTGTGFAVQHDGKPYLITNYHVAAGRNPVDGQPLHGSGAVPDTLRVVQMMPMRPDRIEWQPRDERVLEVGTDRALWLEHPVHGRGADVVALPLQNSEDAELHPYDLTGSAPALKVGPSEGVSIIGFPFGLTGDGAFAIWTRGFIASEPDIDLDDLPSFLVDARTRRGQSGSPVIVYSNGPHRMADGSLSMGAGAVTNLLGVYSGRINEQSDLGRVWKVQAIRDILAAQQLGTAGL